MLCAPLFVWKAWHVQRVWVLRVESVKKNIVPQSEQAQILKQALVESTGQLGKASARAVKATAMEIEMTLAVAGLLLLWFRMREKKMQKKQSSSEQAAVFDSFH
jgi:hypothetical protein